jgi:hypothetical protein
MLCVEHRYSYEGHVRVGARFAHCCRRRRPRRTPLAWLDLKKALDLYADQLAVDIDTSLP